MLEVASESTADVDLNERREDYAALGIGEYWRCDETGDYHGDRLAGERLADGEYVAIDIEELPDESSQEYSGALDLHLRWKQEKLAWYDPATGRRIATFEDERARADAAEARVRELEEQVRRQGL